MRKAPSLLLPLLAGFALAGSSGLVRAQDGSPMRVIIYNSAPAARPAPPPKRAYRPRQRYSDKKMVPVPEFLPDGSPNPDYKPGAMMPAPTPGTDTAPPPAAAPTAPRPAVLLVGDSLADALSEGLGLDEAFRAEFALKTKTLSASGLVRDDFHDWPKAIEAHLREAPAPVAMIVMLGLNDRQVLRAGGETLAPLTPAWREAYVKRVETVLVAARVAKVPVIWVGLPTMRTPSLSNDLAQINAMIRERVTGAGETFVDTFDGFADASGSFTPTGPDIIGDTVRLRGADGIHFTPAGQRKLAFFVDKPLRKRLEASLTPTAPNVPPVPRPKDGEVSVPLPTPKVVAPAPQLPARIRPDVGPVRPLGPAPAAASLAGQPSPQQDPATEALFGQGLSPDPRAGRADDYRWK